MIKFCRVKSDFFVVGDKYSFNIYLYDSLRHKRVLALNSLSEVTAEAIENWKKLEESGAYLQLDKDNMKEFYFETVITEEEINKENEFYFKMEKLQEFRIKKYQTVVNEKFLVKNTINTISKTNNFLPLINRVKAEVLCFPLYQSEIVSITTEVVERLFIRDILPVRAAAFSYMLAKQNKITDIESLCNIIMASLLKDLGLSLIRTSLFKNFQDLKFESIYMKHPMLSIYVLAKTGFDFSKEIKRLILEHHEQADGSGFPREKKENYIDLLSFIINLSDQILMYSMGKFNGRSVDFMKSIEIFHKNIVSDGINISFPPKLLESLGAFLFNEIEMNLEKGSS